MARLTPDELERIRARFGPEGSGIGYLEIEALLAHIAALEDELAEERATATAAMSTADGVIADLEDAQKRIRELEARDA